VEHLVLLGINNDLILETGINPPPNAGAAGGATPS
jgi:hypothetical protein